MTPDVIDGVLRILIAIGIGAVIGAEREYGDKSAGFRTMIMISTGACLFTILSIRIGDPDDVTRIAANIVTGVGFLGAGAILREGGRLMGLTTASAIWLTAALGMGVGGGQIMLVLFATVAILIVLVVFPFIERIIDAMRDRRTYHVTCALTSNAIDEADAILRETGLRIFAVNRNKKGPVLIGSWVTVGSPRQHAAAAQKILAHPDIQEFHA